MSLMTFTGSYHFLCQNGHLHACGVFELDRVVPNRAGVIRCPDCQSPFVWWTLLDESKGADESTGRCPGEIELELIESPKTCTCIGCGQTHLKESPRYKVPAPGLGHHEDYFLRYPDEWDC